MLSLFCVLTAAPARLLRRGVPLRGASSDIRHYPATSGAFQSWLWVEEILCDFPAVAGDLTAGCVLSLQQRHGFTQEEATKQNLEFSAHLWMRRCCFVLHAVCLCCLHAGQCGCHFVAVEVQCLLLTQDHKEKDELRSHNATHVLTIPFLSTLHTPHATLVFIPSSVPPPACDLTGSLFRQSAALQSLRCCSVADRPHVSRVFDLHNTTPKRRRAYKIQGGGWSFEWIRY